MASSHGPRRDAAKHRFWEGCVSRWRKSGLSVREFCRREALSEPLFYSWRRELTRRNGSDSPGVRPPRQGTSQAAGFVRVEIAAPRQVGQRSALEILLPGARRVRVRPGFDRETLQAVLEILERRPC